MALNPKISTVAVNAETDAVTALLNGGYLDIYDGTQPATADTAVGAQVKLARLTFGTPAFGASVAGVGTATAIGNGTGLATSSATWFRTLKSDGTTVVFDGSVGTSGANLNLNSVAIQVGATVSVSAFTYTSQKG